MAPQASLRFSTRSTPRDRSKARPCMAFQAAFSIRTLLWSPAARIPRRGTKFPTQNDFTTGNPEPRFPTAGRSGASRLVVVGYRPNLAFRA
ncbi:hypothetical protein CKAH01_13791 [Colletotrichum kahawae]|uniref:Uncharacterized protein n=1 Tax=Colletotrichum kahawae TaxID=34407 RepID=A0AAD9YQL2_COLKA|nr:hypothetical protein CKAH01_13791 [Colletotrichum kahawae]